MLRVRNCFALLECGQRRLTALLNGGHRRMLRACPQVGVLPRHILRDVADLRHHDLDGHAGLDGPRDVAVTQIVKAEAFQSGAFLRLSQAEFHDV